MKNKFSLFSLLISCVFILGVAFLFYPKWKKTGTEATISWDVSGYYLYLPAAFIYNDVKELKFMPDIMEKYGPTPTMQQAFLHTNKAYVMKYSCGQAVVYSPFFFTAHLFALNTDYEADGFSRPYQFMISFGGLLIALLGLFFLRKILLEYFSDKTTGIVLILMVFATNYLDYAAINSALTHNNLFTIYTILIWQTISFYKKETFRKALFIGFLIGLAALIRPVEILSCLIPILWGVKNPLFSSFKERFDFIKNNFSKFVGAAVICGLVGSLQLIYWRYSGGEWIIYSYQDQGFSWLRPHFYNGFFSYRSGWLIYTPLMFFALIGFIQLWLSKKPILYASLAFLSLFMYITFAWDIWWYGGSLGQRAMIQAYPLLAFPLAAFINSLEKNKTFQYIIGIVFLVFIYMNVWLTYQAHAGGMYRSDQMTKAYFWKTIGRWEMPKHALKLLDTEEEFTGTRQNTQLLFETNFEEDSIIGKCNIEPIEGKQSLCLTYEYQNSPAYEVNPPTKSATWIRASADFKIDQKEWEMWKMTQFVVQFYNNDQLVKAGFIRIQRTMYDKQTENHYIDVKIPKGAYNKIAIRLLSPGSKKPVLIDNLKVEAFD